MTLDLADVLRPEIFVPISVVIIVFLFWRMRGKPDASAVSGARPRRPTALTMAPAPTGRSGNGAAFFVPKAWRNPLV
jgi:hypothetical protein